MDEAALAETFEAALLGRYDDWWQYARFRAGRFKPLVAHRGGVGAARYLIAKPGVAPGFTKLEQAGRLDLTVEALVLAPKFVSLFSERERAIARQRLVDHSTKPDES